MNIHPGVNLGKMGKKDSLETILEVFKIYHTYSSRIAKACKLIDEIDHLFCCCKYVRLTLHSLLQRKNKGRKKARLLFWPSVKKGRPHCQVV